MANNKDIKDDNLSVEELNTSTSAHIFQRDFDILEGHPAHDDEDDDKRYETHTMQKSLIYIIIGIAMIIWQVVVYILKERNIISDGYGFLFSVLMIPVVVVVVLGITKKR